MVSDRRRRNWTTGKGRTPSISRSLPMSVAHLDLERRQHPPYEWLLLQESLEKLGELYLYSGSSPIIGLLADAGPRNKRHVVLAGSADLLCKSKVIDGILGAIVERCEIKDRSTWEYEAPYFRDLISCFYRNEVITGWVAIIPRWKKFANRQMPDAQVGRRIYPPTIQACMKDLAQSRFQIDGADVSCERLLMRAAPDRSVEATYLVRQTVRRWLMADAIMEPRCIHENWFYLADTEDIGTASAGRIPSIQPFHDRNSGIQDSPLIMLCKLCNGWVKILSHSLDPNDGANLDKRVSSTPFDYYRGIPVSGIPVSEQLFAWRTTTTARLMDDAEAMGNDLDPVLCTVGPATAHRRPHVIQLLGRLFPTDLPSPAGPTFRLSATELLPFRERGR